LAASILAGMCWGRDKYSIAAGVAMLILVAIVYSVWMVRCPAVRPEGPGWLACGYTKRFCKIAPSIRAHTHLVDRHRGAPTAGVLFDRHGRPGPEPALTGLGPCSVASGRFGRGDQLANVLGALFHDRINDAEVLGSLV
jgi:hypothetical protein